MRRSSIISFLLVLLVLVAAALLYWAYAPKAEAPTTATTTPATASSTTATIVQYSCDAGKTITARYASNTLALTLSDGRTFDLPQVESGSGIRYEQGAGTAQDVVFSSEGSNAFLTENGTMTYSNCVGGTTGTATSGNVMLKSYTDQGKTFTFNYPNAFSISGGGVGYTQGWMLNATSSGLILAKVTVPQSFEPKTNFVEATLTVGTSPDPSAVAQCLAAPQNGGPQSAAKTVVTINGVPYTQYVTTDAGAGQLYNTTSYRTVRNSQCYAIEYTIHSAELGNFPTSAGITVFDQAAVQNALNGIVTSFKFL